jgi:hypothetical protein
MDSCALQLRVEGWRDRILELSPMRKVETEKEEASSRRENAITAENRNVQPAKYAVGQTFRHLPSSETKKGKGSKLWTAKACSLRLLVSSRVSRSWWASVDLYATLHF